MLGENIYIYIILLTVSIAVFIVLMANIVYTYVMSGRVYMATAGSYHVSDKLCSWEDAIGKHSLEDDHQRIIDSRNYRAFIACGRSMLLCGIDDGFLLLTEKVSLDNKQLFPCVLVLKREEYKQKEAREKGDNAIYKIRRTWAKCEIPDNEEDLLEFAKNIMKRDDFKKVMEKAKAKDAYKGDEEMLDKLKESYQKYISEHEDCKNRHNKNHEILLSTTLYVDENEVRFSIHPARTVEGKVVYAYDLKSEESIAA